MGLGQKIKAKVHQIKQELCAIYLAAKDRRTPWYGKAMATLAIGYALSPLDLIPDCIPVLGLVDDLLIVPGLIWLAVKLIPAEVLAEQRACIARGEMPPLKPNWFFGALIILLWLGLVLWLLLDVFKIFG